MSIITDQKQIMNLLDRGVENIYPSKDFLKSKLEKGEQLTLYVGIDPTGSDLHLGHYIFLRKMREFQNLGHKIILLIGDFTGMIGDPTNKTATRVRLTRDEVLKNAEHYKEQASKIISFEGENPAELKYNSEWLSKLSFGDVIELSSNFTVQQMMERDMFKKRIEEGKVIYFHEFLYPLMQAYDSVAMNVDGELGGNDQTFNMLAGRDLMKKLKNKEKFVLTTKLLVDPTGKKMGKSEGNMIRLIDTSDEMFGKVMSWTDGMIDLGFELLTDLDIHEINEIKNQFENPRDQKAKLAREIVSGFYGSDEADSVSERFDQTFKDKEVPENIPDLKIDEPMNIVDVLIKAEFAKSKTDARRLIEGGGVKVDEQVESDPESIITATEDGVLIQKGKRFFVRVRN